VDANHRSIERETGGQGALPPLKATPKDASTV